jgi:inosine-uridine nucleoside N-ribohydrolase
MAAAGIASAQIVFDTDSGFFGDDGVALTMLLRSPRAAELSAVTVVAGNVWTRTGANYMRRNLDLLGRPALAVHVGAQRPLVHTAAMVKREGDIEFSGAFSLPPEAGNPSTAVDAIVSLIERAPGKVTILAIGPLTNIALLLRQRPDLETKIGSLVFMGGSVNAPGNSSKAAEFNFWFDPEAARIVLRSAIPKKVMFGLDVSSRVKLTKAIFDRVIAVSTPITDLYRQDFGERYPGFLKNPQAAGSLWDELPAAYLIDPAVVTRSEAMHLDVETTLGPRYGAVTKLDPALAPDATPVEAVLDMSFDRVFDIYVKALTAR